MSSTTGTGQGGMAQKVAESTQGTAGKQNGEMQGSLMEEVCPAKCSEECSPPACFISLCSWSTTASHSAKHMKEHNVRYVSESQVLSLLTLTTVAFSLYQTMLVELVVVIKNYHYMESL